MVKKGSILSRIADRFRSGSGVRVNEGDRTARSGARSGPSGGSRLGGAAGQTGGARVGRVDAPAGAGLAGDPAFSDASARLAEQLPEKEAADATPAIRESFRKSRRVMSSFIVVILE